MGDYSCVHLKNFKASKGIEQYDVISSIFVWSINPKYRKVKALCCFCHVCQYRGPSLLSCFHCVSFACHEGKHMQDHAKSKKHFLAVDLSFGNIFCFHCGDFVYDKELLEIGRRNKELAYKYLGLPNIDTSFKLDPTKIVLLRLNPVKNPVPSLGSIGIRRLTNLGNTCFLNSIIQVLTHISPLRDYFLSKSHICSHHDEGENCLKCETVNLFQEYYSGLETPLTLHRLLHLIWMHAKHLAGNKQQDAHEFLMATLNVLHQHCKDSDQISNISRNSNHCTCIIDQIFTGGLQSDVVCQACKGVSTTIDPFWDISLDLSDGTSTEKQDKEKNGPITLEDCLQQFTCPEHIDSVIVCNNCNENQKATKQLTIQKLPVVVCFHLKRFEYVDVVRRKVTTIVSFPEFLDMTPFLSHHYNKPNVCKEPPQISLEDNRYSLFAVVNHRGSTDLGHYVTFVKHLKDQWFKCNDDIIVQVKKSDVFACEGYLLFYHKKILEYE